jgi:hypothetical protein
VLQVAVTQVADNLTGMVQYVVGCRDAKKKVPTVTSVARLDSHKNVQVILVLLRNAMRQIPVESPSGNRSQWEESEEDDKKVTIRLLWSLHQ